MIADFSGLLIGNDARFHTLAEQNAYFAIGERIGVLWFFTEVRGSAIQVVLDGIHGGATGAGRRREPVAPPWA